MIDPEKRPVLIVVAGPNGSGKTSVTSKILHHQWLENSVYINPDIVAQERFGDWNSKDAIMKAVKYCEEWRETCLKERKSLIFETVMSADDKVDYIERALMHGFFVRVFFVCTSSPTINASRIASRVMKGGHDVPITKVISRYQKSILNCKHIADKVDRLYLYDNSIENNEAQLLIRLSKGHIVKQYATTLPEWANIIVNDCFTTD
ncbi:MAG: zeta toxin family protein [Bacteroidales bacterium]|nr:zeta toxin family protein [Bacteroidales bacterium]